MSSDLSGRSGSLDILRSSTRREVRELRPSAACGGGRSGSLIPGEFRQVRGRSTAGSVQVRACRTARRSFRASGPPGRATSGSLRSGHARVRHLRRLGGCRVPFRVHPARRRASRRAPRSGTGPGRASPSPCRRGPATAARRRSCLRGRLRPRAAPGSPAVTALAGFVSMTTIRCGGAVSTLAGDVRPRRSTVTNVNQYSPSGRGPEVERRSATAGRSGPAPTARPGRGRTAGPPTPRPASGRRG